MEGLEVVGAMLKFEEVIDRPGPRSGHGERTPGVALQTSKPVPLAVGPPSTHKDALVSFPSVSLSQILVRPVPHHSSSPSSCLVLQYWSFSRSIPISSISRKLGGQFNRSPRALSSKGRPGASLPVYAKSPNPTSPGFTHTRDLVNGPFAVIKSGAGLLATLACALDVQGLQVTGPYDAEAWDPATFTLFYHLVFCSSRRENSGALENPSHSTTLPTFTDLSHLTTAPTCPPRMC